MEIEAALLSSRRVSLHPAYLRRARNGDMIRGGKGSTGFPPRQRIWSGISLSKLPSVARSEPFDSNGDKSIATDLAPKTESTRPKKYICHSLANEAGPILFRSHCPGQRTRGRNPMWSATLYLTRRPAAQGA